MYPGIRGGYKWDIAWGETAVPPEIPDMMEGRPAWWERPFGARQAGAETLYLAMIFARLTRPTIALR